MLEIYESGSGARNSWGEKTQGVRIGRSRDPDEDPLPLLSISCRLIEIGSTEAMEC